MTALLAVFLILQQGNPAGQSPEAIRQSGSAQEAMFNFDAALRIYRTAIAARPDFLPAHIDYMRLMVRTGRHLQLRNEYADSSTRLGRCLSAIAWGISAHDVPLVRRKYAAILAKDGRTPCSEIAHAWSGDDSLAFHPELIRRAMEEYGSSALLSQQYAAALVQAGRTSDARNYLRKESENSIGLEKFRLLRALAVHYSISGERNSAQKIVDAMERQSMSDGRPYPGWILLESKRMLAESNRGIASFSKTFAAYNSAMFTLARGKAPALAFEALTRDAQENIDRGEYLSALKALNIAVKIADSLNAAELQMRARLFRGRALNARGEYAKAIPDLSEAADRGRLLRERYRTAEAFQFLARAYTAQKDWRRATAAADSFAVTGQGIRDPSKRMVLLYEAGMIYLQAGYHERSRRYFEQMVRTIDRDRMNFEYAGEYLERTGDYARALRYYRDAYRLANSGSPKLALSGMVRVYSAMGMRDSAEAAARTHDALPLNPQFEILRPRLLLQRGDTAEARSLALQWLRLQLQRGNPAATANAYNLLAEIELQGNPKAAISATVNAERYALPLSLSSQLAQAFRLRGLANTRLGLRSAAEYDLQRARAFARVQRDALAEVILLTELGDAVTPRRAMGYYARANHALDRVTLSLADPVVAARLRDARRTLFDNALRGALRLDGDSALAAVAIWSARKKRAQRAFHLRTLKTGRNTPVVDFIVVADRTYAVVYGKEGARLVALPMNATRAGQLAAQVVNPYMRLAGGNIDIGRARFPVTAAQALYDGLLRPLEKMLPPGPVTIVPDVPLQTVPFDALVRARPAPAPAPGVHFGNDSFVNTEFAIDRWAFSFALDPVSALSPHPGLRVSSAPATFIGQDAPGLENELSSILKYWAPNGVELLTGKAATKERLRTKRGSAILHFVTHGVSDDADPLRSHLVLAPDHGDDGLLHAAEISGTVKGTSLVFLSACETAAGPLFSGTGTLSLARFFLNAGVRGVVATAWPISAVGADISGEFYRRLKQGSNPGDALHAAKLTVRRNARTAQPFYWASHVYVER